MHSAEKVFRGIVRVRSPNGDARVWLTVHGVWKTTVSMVGSEVTQLCKLLIKAQQAGARRSALCPCVAPFGSRSGRFEPFCDECDGLPIAVTGSSWVPSGSGSSRRACLMAAWMSVRR